MHTLGEHPEIAQKDMIVTSPQRPPVYPPNYRPMGHPVPAYRPPHPVMPRPVVARPMPVPQVPRPLSMWQREEILTRYIHEQARCGQRMVARHAGSATLYGPATHLPVAVHLVLTLCTLSMWALPWALMQRSRRFRQVHVDQQGRVHSVIVRHGALI